jgi:1,4-dihydroxy-2-naphthoate octaprenyltransferase
MVFGAYLVLPVTWLAGDLKAWVLLPVLTLPLALRLNAEVSRRTDGPSLNAALARTGMLQLAFCILLSAGILLSG